MASLPLLTGMHDTFPTIGNGRGESGKRCGSAKGGSSMLAAVGEGLRSICRNKATTDDN